MYGASAATLEAGRSVGTVTRVSGLRCGAFVLCALAVLGSCAGDDDETGAPPTSAPRSKTTVSPTTTTIPTTTTTRGPRGSGEPVTLAFAGDTHFEGELESQLANNPEGMLAPIAPVLSQADLAIVNLETAITERGTPEAKAFNFRAPATALTAVASAGIDVVSMANNHGVDYGPVGLLDSLAAKNDSGFPIVGIGANAAEAYAPHTTDIKGQRIAIIGATQVLDDSLINSWTATDDHAGIASAKEVERLVQSVRDARVASDTVVVFLHWGTERQTCPSASQEELAQQLADAGADLIVGGHAHRVQGAGRLGAAFVAYGLGNFIWYADPGPSAETGVLLVTVAGREIDSYEWVPAQISNGVPRPLEGDAAATARTSWDGLRGCTNLTP